METLVLLGLWAGFTAVFGFLGGAVGGHEGMVAGMALPTAFLVVLVAAGIVGVWLFERRLDPWHLLRDAAYRRTGSLADWLRCRGFRVYRRRGRVYMVPGTFATIRSLGRWNAVPEPEFADIDAGHRGMGDADILRLLAEHHDARAPRPSR